VVYAAPELRLRDKVSQRSEQVERELPFFSLLVHVLGSAGVPLYEVLTGVVDAGMFPAIRTEAMMVRRDVAVFGADPNEALERLASGHPSRKFRSFVYGYTSKVRSGGDMPAYLSGESGSLLRELEESWERYAARAGMVGSMMVTVFGLMPLMLIVVGVFSPAASLNGIVLFTAVGVPSFTVFLVYLAGRLQPVGERPPTGNLLGSLLVAALGAAPVLLFGAPWLSVAAFTFLLCVSYGLSVRNQMREMKDIDDALPEFLKDVLDFKRQEYDLTKSLRSISLNNRYNESFDRILARVAVQLKAGVPVDELALDPRTNLARLMFLVLGQMWRSGGGTVDTVYQLSAYAEKVVAMKRSTVSEMKPYLVLSYLSPLLLAFGVTFVGGLLRSFGSGASPGLSALGISGSRFGGSAAAMSEVSSILIVVSAAALGIIAAKMVDFTVRNTIRSSMNVAVAVAATYVLSSVGLQGLTHLVP
jgi:flagellar protein FlaJ